MDTCNSGVYLIRSRKTNDSYVGASTNLKQRIKAQLSEISKLTRYGVGNFFFGHDRDEIEVRILEWVVVPADQVCRLHSYAKATPAVKHLLDREQFWMDKLKPTLNVKGNRKVELESFPVGPPEVA